MLLTLRSSLGTRRGRCFPRCAVTIYFFSRLAKVLGRALALVSSSKVK